MPTTSIKEKLGRIEEELLFVLTEPKRNPEDRLKLALSLTRLCQEQLEMASELTIPMSIAEKAHAHSHS
jgi:hypothetical protein